MGIAIFAYSFQILIQRYHYFFSVLQTHKIIWIALYIQKVYLLKIIHKNNSTALRLSIEISCFYEVFISVKLVNYYTICPRFYHIKLLICKFISESFLTTNNSQTP